MKSRFLQIVPVISMILLLMIGSLTLLGQTNTWDGSSSANWNTAANWSLNVVPTSAHDVVIPNGITSNISVNTAAVCNSFTMNSGSNNNTVTISTGNSLTVNGAVTINNTTAATKILAVASGTLSCASITMSNTSSNSNDCRVTITTGTVNVSGNITMNGNASRNQVTFTGGGTLNLGGSISGGDLERATGCIVNYNGSSAQTVAINSDYQYYHLHLNNTTASGATLQAAITTTNVTGDVRVQSGLFSNGGFAIAGNSARTFEVANGATFKLTSTSSMVTGFGTKTFGLNSTVDYAGGNQTISPENYGHLTVSAGSKTIAASAVVNVNGELTNSGTITMTAGTSSSNTWLVMAGNVTNNNGATITSTANYTRFIFNSANPQIFTNNGTMTSPVASFDVANSHGSGLTLAGSNNTIVTRVNLFYGTVTNSNKFTLGTGGSSWAVVQRGMDGSTSAAGTFDVAPTFNIGTGGYYLLYDYGTSNYTADKEIPPSETASTVVLFPTTAVTISLAKNLTISDMLTFYGGNVGTLDIGAHTLTINGQIHYASGTLQGGSASNIVLGGSSCITLPPVTNNLNNLTISNTIGAILSNSITINGTLTLSDGFLVNGSYLTMANGSTISRSSGKLVSNPIFAGIVNLVYTGGTSISTAKELPTGLSVLNDLTTNSGGTVQSGIPTGTVSTSYSQGFNNLTIPSDWTATVITNGGTLGTPALTYVTSGSNPTVTPSEGSRFVRFNSYTCDAGDQIQLRKSSSPISTTGKTEITVVFDWYMDNAYPGNFDNVMVQWSTDGTNWNNSMIYYRYSATNGWVTISTLLPSGAENQTNLYIAFLFTSDYGNNCSLDNVRVNVTTPGAPTASTATVNGTLDLSNGLYTIGANTLALNGGLSGSNAIVGGPTSNLTVGGSGSNLVLPTITNGLNNFMITRPNGTTIASTKSLTVNGTLTNSVGNSGLIIKADNSGNMGSLIHNTSNVPATVEQYLSSERWHLVSPPVSDATINVYYDIYLKEYNEYDNTWNDLVNPTTIPMNATQGYYAWVEDDWLPPSNTVKYQGLLNSGNYNLTGFGYNPSTNPSYYGFRMVGNPYPCALDWNTDASWNRVNLSGWMVIKDNNTYKGWNPYLTGNESWNGMTSGIIPSTQGFWVRATSSGASMTIPASQRVHSSQYFYKSGQEKTDPTVRLKIMNNGMYDETVLIFHPFGTDEYDGLYDLGKFSNGTGSPDLYTMVENQDFAVNVMSPDYFNKVIPVYFRGALPGLCQISASEVVNFDLGYNVYLEDLKTGIVTLLEDNAVYDFTYSPLDDLHRFNIHFKDAWFGIDEDGEVNGILIYAHDNLIHINLTGDDAANVTVFDLTGRELLNQKITGSQMSQIKLNAETGYYLVKVQTGGKFITQKVFIK